MRGAPSDVTGGELEFSESERVYGRGYSRIDRSSEIGGRQSGNVESFGTVNLDRLRTDGLRGQQRTHQGTSMGYRDTRRVDSYNSEKEEALLRVFTKSATALFNVNPVPKGKSMMVRVGGGWMKVEHHRNHHIPLKVYEHQRDANRDKFLFIKSRFATKKKYVPIAYRKYREEIVRDPWDPSVKLT